MVNERRTPEVRFDGFYGNWTERFLGDVLEIWSAARVHKDEWTTEGVPFFRSSDIMSAILGKDNVKAFISEDLFNALSAISGKVKKDDVLVTGGGSIAMPYLVPNDDPLYFKDGDLLLLRDKTKENVLGQFLYYFFISPSLRRYVASITHIGTISHYTIEQAKTTTAFLPDVEEQAFIGNFFRNLDDTIALKKQQYEQTVNIKKSMLEKMFPQKGADVPEIRLEGFRGAWERHKLGDVAVFSKGSGYSKADLEQSGTPIILYGRLYTKYETVIDDVDTYATLKDGSIISQGGEVIVPSSGETAEDIARASVVVQSGVILGGDLNIVKANISIDPIFLTLTISNGTPQRELSKKAQGKSVVHIRNSDLQELEFITPDIKEQAAIGNFFRNLDTLIETQREELEKLQNIKKACLSKMFV